MEQTLTISHLESRSSEELQDLARELGVEDGVALGKQELVLRVLRAHAEHQGYILASGLLEIVNDGYGFLRQKGSRPSQGDVYISQSQIRRFGLRTGDQVTGQVRAPKEGERYYGLVRVEAVNGSDPETTRTRPNFDVLIRKRS